MSDIFPAIVIATGGAIASKDVINRILGPTADYIGEGGRNLVKKGTENLSRIFQATYSKLKETLDNEGRVNPRVLKNVLDEGPFVEDIVAAEYFGGLLASARTASGQDDSALPMLTLVKSLSTDQLRLHFVIYSILTRHRWGVIAPNGRFWLGLELSAPVSEIASAMECRGADCVAHLLLALNGLVDSRLIDDNYSLHVDGSADYRNSGASNDMLTVRPNERGTRLFLRVLGLRGVHTEVIASIQLDDSLSDSIKNAVCLPPNAWCRHVPVIDQKDSKITALEDKISDLEDEIDCLENEMKERGSNS